MTVFKEILFFWQMVIACYYEDQKMLHASLLVPSDIIELLHQTSLPLTLHCQL